MGKRVNEMMATDAEARAEIAVRVDLAPCDPRVGVNPRQFFLAACPTALRMRLLASEDYEYLPVSGWERQDNERRAERRRAKRARQAAEREAREAKRRAPVTVVVEDDIGAVQYEVIDVEDACEVVDLTGEMDEAALRALVTEPVATPDGLGAGAAVDVRVTDDGKVCIIALRDFEPGEAVTWCDPCLRKDHTEVMLADLRAATGGDRLAEAMIAPMFSRTIGCRGLGTLARAGARKNATLGKVQPGAARLVWATDPIRAGMEITV